MINDNGTEEVAAESAEKQDTGQREPAHVVKGWSITAMAIETGMDRNKVRTLLAGVKPCEETARGPKYLLRDLILALRGTDGEVQKRSSAALARQQEADADLAEMERDKQLKTVIDREVVFTAWEEIIVPAKEKLQNMASKLRSAAGLSEGQAKKLDLAVSELLEDLAQGPNYKRQAAEGDE